MSEVQKHGFKWQDELLINVYGATYEELKEISYTGKLDLPAKYNRLSPHDISVKTCKDKKGICMGDCLRVYDSCELHMTVIFYIQNGSKKIIKSIIEVDLPNLEELFGSITLSQIKELDAAVKCVPQKRKPTPEEHAHMYSIKKRLQKESGIISLAIKCNHEQSRLQCTIPFRKFQAFIKKYPERVIAVSQTNEFRGGSISAELESPPRKFKETC